MSILGRAALWTLIVFACFYIIKAIYRITLHPLARFPGPKLPAMTRCYEAYYEVFVDGTGGKFGEKIEEWHKQYGPIIRINPFELHVNDPEFFDELFNFNPHLWKRTFAIDNLVHTPSSAQYKKRRQVLQNYFSQQKTLQMTYIVRDRIKALANYPVARKGTGEPIKASLIRFVEDPEYSEGYFSSTQNTFKNIYFFPRAMSHKIRSDTDRSPPTIFDEYKDNRLPPEEKTPNRIFQVALMPLGAGAGTPSYVLDIATYYILADPAISQRVKAELVCVWPDPADPAPDVSVLEDLPFLRGCVKEALRLALGPMARLQDMKYGEWTIPRGTPVGMTHRFIHHDPAIYPDPFEFKPGRWMQGDESKKLEKYLVTLRGSRQCLAILLAYTELYLSLATLFRQFDLELYETDRTCVDPKYDYFAPFPEKHDLSNGRLRFVVQDSVYVEGRKL
ncbi:cytochrome P450 [Coniochaeta sp. 2T2.1]|nr:cytochrome P450 [Coniochaeta sp. 2T2.1]